MALVRTSDAALVWARNEVGISEVVDSRLVMDQKKLYGEIALSMLSGPLVTPFLSFKEHLSF